MVKISDIVLTQDVNPISLFIMSGERGSFAHSAIVSEVDEKGNIIKIIEAMSQGVEENKIHYDHYGVFSVIDIKNEQRQLALEYAKNHIGEGYSYLQDVGFALNGLREIAGWKRIPDLLAEHSKIVCSALVDLSLRNGGIILRPERDAGDVTPQGISFSKKVRLIDNHDLWEL